MNRTALTVVLVILLLASLGSNTFLYINKMKSDKELQNKMAVMKAKDSLQAELIRMEDSLNLVIQTFQNENQTLVLKVEELEGDKNPRVIAAMQEIYRLRREIANGISGDVSGSTAGTDGATAKKSTKESRKAAKSGKGGDGNVEDLRKQLEEARAKVAELMALVESLTKEKNDFMTQLTAEKDRSATLESENVELKDRLDKGARPQFGALLVTGLYDKKGIMTETMKSKTVDKIRVTFDVLENPMVTQPLEEEVIIRIIDPNGGVLSTTNSKLTDKSKVTSLKQTIQFDGALQKVKWSFPEKGLLTGKLMKGKYTAELWTRGLMRQKNNFTLE
jgi:predicted nuclease with TOPRIM domain